MRRQGAAATKVIVWILIYTVVFLLGVVLMNVGDIAWLDATGSSLIATGLAGWVILGWVLFTHRRERQLEILTEFGIVDAFPVRSMKIREEYEKRVSTAREHIDILGFGLRALREDFLSEFPVWAERATVRILLIDPDWPDPDYAYANQRDIEENTATGTIRREVEAFLNDTQDLRDTSDTFEVRLYRCLPHINIFRVDDEMFYGPYLVDDVSRNLPTMLVKQGGRLFDRLAVHFDMIWREYAHNPNADGSL